MAEDRGDDVRDRDWEIASRDRYTECDRNDEHQRKRHGGGARSRGDRHRDHSSASLRRRTSATKNGEPTNAVTMPTWSSAGRATTRPMMSEPSSSIGASTAEYANTHR